MKKVVIIGGGIGGLATAGLLASRGYNVQLFEAREQLGGRMGLLEHNGFRFDTGPSWYLMPEVYEHFFSLLGSSADAELALHRLTPAYKVFSEASTEPITIYGDEARDTAFFGLREAGGDTHLTHYLDSAETTYRLALKHFLYTDFRRPATLLSKEVLRHGLAMLRRSTQSMDAYISSLFKDPVLKQILEYPAVFLGGSPYDTPALYHLMSYLDFRQGVFYPTGGMFSVTEATARLASRHGAKLHTNAAVSSIIIEQGKATGVQLANGSSIAADIVIANSDLEYTQRALLPAAAQDYPPSYWEKRQPGPSALLMYIGVKGTVPQLEHHNLFFVEAWQQNFETIYTGTAWPEKTSMYVSKPSATDPLAAPKGFENIFVLVPLPANTTIVPEDIEAWADQYLEQIASQAGIPDLRSRVIYRKLFQPKEFETEFHSWRATALGLSHRLSQSALFRPATKSKKVQGLYYVGANVQPGIGVPMCLISAELVAKDILGIRTAGPILEDRS